MYNHNHYISTHLFLLLCSVLELSQSEIFPWWISWVISRPHQRKVGCIMSSNVLQSWGLNQVPASSECIGGARACAGTRAGQQVVKQSSHMQRYIQNKQAITIQGLATTSDVQQTSCFYFHIIGLATDLNNQEREGGGLGYDWDINNIKVERYMIGICNF